jgi:hypothetical protein
MSVSPLMKWDEKLVKKGSARSDCFNFGTVGRFCCSGLRLPITIWSRTSLRTLLQNSGRGGSTNLMHSEAASRALTGFIFLVTVPSMILFNSLILSSSVTVRSAHPCWVSVRPGPGPRRRNRDQLGPSGFSLTRTRRLSFKLPTSESGYDVLGRT